MMSMICNIWDDFSLWVTSWADLTYILVMCAFSIVALVSILGFLKGNKFNRDKKPFKWASLVLALVMLAIILVLGLAKI